MTAEHYPTHMYLWMDRLALTIFIVAVGISVAAQGAVGFTRVDASRTVERPLVSLETIRAPATQGFEQYASIFERDIFMTDDDRTLRATGYDQLPPQPPVRWDNDYQLKAVIIDYDPRAVVGVKGQSEVHFLKVGDHLQEAVLKRIGVEGVWFSYRGQDVELTFDEAVAQ